jgi:hypothetical protein
MGNVILFLAGDNARLASNTFIQIDHHPPFCHLLLLKFEARNPKFETISNDQILNVPNKRV